MSAFTGNLEYQFTGSYTKGFHNPLYVLTKDLTYIVGTAESPLTTVTVPAGFLTDFATVPPPLNYLFHPDGPWAPAACLHDYMYDIWKYQISRFICDCIFLEAMYVLSVYPPIALVFFMIVRLFGKFS